MDRMFSILALAACVASFTHGARAQQMAYVEKAGGSAQQVANRALACLRRGEDSYDDAVKLNEYRKGRELARQAVVLDDRNADAHFALFANNGRIMLLEGAGVNPVNLWKASAELERTLEIDPNHADALA